MKRCINQDLLGCGRFVIISICAGVGLRKHFPESQRAL